MVKRGVSIGFLGRFGRSQDMRYLDASLRSAGLHPSLVPEGVKMAAVSLMAEDGPEPPAGAYPPVGALMALAALGEEEFARNNGEPARRAVLGRLERALEVGKGLDASIVLLMLHAGLLHPALRDDYGIEADQEPG